MNDGLVDGNSLTDFSSAGDFDEWKAQMYAEEVKGNINIIIKLKRVKGHALDIIFDSNVIGLRVANKIYETMKKLGYRDLNS